MSYCPEAVIAIPLGMVPNGSWPFGSPTGDLANWGHFYNATTEEQYVCDPENPPEPILALLPGFACDNSPNMGPAGTYGGPLLASSSYYRWVVNCINGASGERGAALLLTQDQCIRMTATMPYPGGLGYGFGWIFAKNSDGSIQYMTHEGTNTYNIADVLMFPGQGTGKIYFACTNGNIASSSEQMVQAILQGLTASYKCPDFA